MNDYFFRVLLILLLLSASSTALAGRPWYVDEDGSGVPYRWPRSGQTGKATVRIYFDRGPLVHGAAKESLNIDNAEAIDMVKKAWKNWEDAGLHLPSDIGDPVRVVDIDFVDRGFEGDAAIDETNYEPYTRFDEPDRHTVIIFDEGGRILEDMYGDATGIIGLTEIYTKDTSTKYIKNATIFLNGKIIEDELVTIDKFVAAIIHELGHLLNLDHSMLADEYAGEDMAVYGTYMPTMYPYIVTPAQKNLNTEDKAWAATLYPDSGGNFFNKFCTISGVLNDVSGRGFQGAQILVRDLTFADEEDVYTQAITAITGSAYHTTCYYDDSGNQAYCDCAEKGEYVVKGLVPGKRYSVVYGAIPEFDNLASGIDPFVPPRSDFGQGNIAHSGGEVEFKCEQGGETITADPTNLLADLDEEPYYSQCGEAGDGGGGGGSNGDGSGSAFETRYDKPWCSLVSGSPFDLGFLWVFLSPAVIFVFRNRKYS